MPIEVKKIQYRKSSLCLLNHISFNDIPTCHHDCLANIIGALLLNFYKNYIQEKKYQHKKLTAAYNLLLYENTTIIHHTHNTVLLPMKWSNNYLSK